MILSDGGFHKRKCFIAPDYDAHNAMENRFNTRISSARCIVENAFGLLKMKWRRLHQHSIAENTKIIPLLVLCACVLHNICIDAGDVDDEENAAVEVVRQADRVIINRACERVLRNNGNGFAHGAPILVNDYRVKLGLMYNMWVNLREGMIITLNELKIVYGAAAYAYNDEVVI